MPKTGITRGLGTWFYQDNYVERFMDNAAYTAAHPDDTLIMAGPPRTPAKDTKATDIQSQLLAIGHLQQVQFTQQKPTQPVMAVGSGRTFFVSGKAQGQATLGRLFVNGRNMLRVLNHNAVAGGLKMSNLDDRAARESNRQFYINLDSELYLIPFGLGALFRDKIHNTIGGFYAELALITTYAVGLTAGQNMVLEQTNLVFDRLVPFFEKSKCVDQTRIPQSTLDKIMGFTDATLSSNTQDISGNIGQSTLP